MSELRIVLVATVWPVALAAVAQPFAVGHISAVPFDALRARDVPVELYYPADAAGESVPASSGSFPVLVMGHGFVMDVAAYGNIVEVFVPHGYIVALPGTEGGFLPDHALFAGDLAFLAEHVQDLGSDGASPLFGAVAPQSAIMGHSMGGGASMLAAASASAIAAVVNFSAAETNPSAIAAAPAITAPTLMFAASEDCVTPLADHQQPMYDALTNACRALVNITGGGHCYFANTNFNCSFGEFTCGPDLAITREQQQDVASDLALLWLDHFVKGDASAWNAFNDSIAVTSRAICSTICLSTPVPEHSLGATVPWYDPETGCLSGMVPGARVLVSDPSGRRVADMRAREDGRAEFGGHPPGVYIWRATVARSMQGSGCFVQP